MFGGGSSSSGDASMTAPEICTDDCVPSWSRKQHSTSHLLLSSLPFILTFSVISVAVLHRLFPALCGSGARNHSPEGRVRKRIAAIAFSTTLGATGVLAELILCEISEWVDNDARRLAFRVVVAMLLFCLIIVIPLLQLHSLVEASAIAKWRRKYVALVEAIAFAGWLWVFWSLGDRLPIRKPEWSVWSDSRTMSEECIARVGVVGVSLMALLSGFGCISSPWQTFTAKPRPVTDMDISRAQAGLDATTELLDTKKARLRMLERKVQEKKSSQEGLMSKMLSSIRGDADTQECSILSSEIDGLTTMRFSLSAELSELQRRLASQQRAKTPMGRLLTTVMYGFSIYCIYRIIATSIAHVPFLHGARSDSSFSQRDPINNLLALLAKHWDPHLDRAAWSRQISFAFSGIIIAGSLGSVMTTMNMLMRAAPGVVGHAVKGDNPNLALFVSQLSAIYVMASALLLRSNLPPHMSTVITEALGAPLDPAFVDRWFDGLFLGAAGVTALAMVIGRKSGWWGTGKEDIFGSALDDMEAGKRC